MRTPLKPVDWDYVNKIAAERVPKIEKTYEENGIIIKRYESAENTYGDADCRSKNRKAI